MKASTKPPVSLRSYVACIFLWVAGAKTSWIQAVDQRFATTRYPNEQFRGIDVELERVLDPGVPSKFLGDVSTFISEAVEKASRLREMKMHKGKITPIATP